MQSTPALVPILTALLNALIATPLVRALARRVGAVAQPKADRWHRAPTAMLGGVAIFLSVIVALLVTGLIARLAILVAASALMFFVGLIDDFIHLRPYQKLVAQIGASAIVIGSGYVLPWSAFPALNVGITILWLVGITNAVNMLDNMDGLAVGIAAIAAIFAAFNFIHSGQLSQATILGTFAAALLGFLVYNFNPASIFMGDCGSLFVGFFLASSVLMTTIGGRSRSILAVLTVPVLILFIPIFDTTLVTIVRKMSGRAASQGGRDHTSHRLVALGLQERTAVLLLYALAIAAGGAAVVSRDLSVDLSIVVTAGFIVLMVFLGLYLARVKVYTNEEIERAQQRPIVAFLIDLSYKRRFFEVLLDAGLVVLAYYLAYRIRFGPVNGGGDWRLFFDTLPLIIGTKIVMFYATGLYRGLWRYVSFDDMFVFAKAVGASAVACMLALLLVSRFEGMSRLLFVYDAVILFLLIAITRSSFRALRTILRGFNRAEAESGIRTLIVGAGDGGELVLREMRNNPAFHRVPVGFLDDDPRKIGKVIHGLRIFGGTNDAETTIDAERVAALVVSTRLQPERMNALAALCAQRDIPLDELRITIAPVEHR
jgi:UDP-GlcNAc:undecaprenyl-phosphate GlcNAc-1-phosphate transferase